MYSWKTIRAFCAVLLVLPLIHLVILLSREAVTILDDSPAAWQDDMDAYIRADERMSLPEKPIVVVGGRRVSLWEGLEDLAAPKPVLMRPLGQAIVEDIIHFHERLISFYRPQTVVFLPGNSEFRLRDSKNGQDFDDKVAELVSLCTTQDSTRRFYVFAPIKTPLYPQDHKAIDDARQRVARRAANSPRLVLLDPNPLLADASGAPDPANFWSDGVQLSERGYLRLSLMLRDQLRKDYPEDYAPN